jgi:LytS/YehU family sensor histidine kinase
MDNKIQKHRSWLISALVSIVFFAGALATKWIATDLEPKIANYRWIAYVIGGISLIVTIVLGVRSAGESAVGATSSHNISIGGSANNSTNTIGDNNTVNSSRNR